MKVKPGLNWKLQYVGHARAMRQLPRRAAEREKCVFVTKVGRGSHLSPLMSDIELQDVEIALLSFDLALFQYFLTMTLFSTLGMVILCI